MATPGTNEPDDRIAEAWLTYQIDSAPRGPGRRGKGLENHDFFWAWEVMWDLCREAPDRALRIIQMLCDRTEDDWILACIGAGPLEDLLHHHGETHIDAILAANRASRSLRRALMGVWTSSMRPAVREKMDAFHATYGRL